MLNQSNVHSELAILVEKFARAVQRVDKEKYFRGDSGKAAGRGAFFCDDGNRRGDFAQAAKNQFLSLLVCDRDGRLVWLHALHHRSCVMPHDYRAGFARYVQKPVNQFLP
jgi:hypothetical protein